MRVINDPHIIVAIVAIVLATVAAALALMPEFKPPPIDKDDGSPPFIFPPF